MSAQHGRGRKPRSFSLNRKSLIIIASVASLSVAGVVFAAQISIGTVEKGSGLVDTPACLVSAKIDFTYAVAANGATTVSQVSVTGVGDTCASNYVSLKLVNSSGTTVDEIIWQPVLGSGATSFTLRADGSTTSTSNSTTGTVTTVWPASQTSPEGLQSVSTSSVQTARLGLLTGNRAATN